MNISNRLIILRDQFGYLQQDVASAMGVSKSTYCRYERGLSEPKVNEIEKLLELYNISYEEFAGLSFPIKKTLSYPPELLNRLRETLKNNAVPAVSYPAIQGQLDAIDEALEPLLKIRQAALQPPDVDLSDFLFQRSTETDVKTVVVDARSEALIDRAIDIKSTLYNAMLHPTPASPPPA